MKSNQGKARLAIDGGSPSIETKIQYGSQSISQEDIDAVVGVLQSSYLTTGPLVEKFESAFANAVDSAFAVSFSSGTAALHGCLSLLDLTPEDEVIVPAITFVATANAVRYNGGKPVFADVSPDTLLIDPESIQRCITSNTKAIIVMEYGGQACPYPAIRKLIEGTDIVLVSDACHGLGGSLNGEPIGSLADMTAFSFHPVKSITTAEGGMVTTDHPTYAQNLRTFRNHGIAQTHKERQTNITWKYDVSSLGYNYRLNDVQCALGLSQLSRLDAFIEKRNRIAQRYHDLLTSVQSVQPLTPLEQRRIAYHLFVVRLDASLDRTWLFEAMHAEGVGVNVHYIPVYYHSSYASMGYEKGLCPQAEKAYASILTLPLHVKMQVDDVDRVVQALKKVLSHVSV